MNASNSDALGSAIEKAVLDELTPELLRGSNETAYWQVVMMAQRAAFAVIDGAFDGELLKRTLALKGQTVELPDITTEVKE